MYVLYERLRGGTVIVAEVERKLQRALHPASPQSNRNTHVVVVRHTCRLALHTLAPGWLNRGRGRLSEVYFGVDRVKSILGLKILSKNTLAPPTFLDHDRQITPSTQPNLSLNAIRSQLIHYLGDRIFHSTGDIQRHT